MHTLIVIAKIMYNQNPMAMLPWHDDHSNDAFVQVGEDIEVACSTLLEDRVPDMDAWYKKTCEQFFEFFNEGGQGDNRSMSVGDRVDFEFGDGTVSYRCAGEGWEKVL